MNSPTKDIADNLEGQSSAIGLSLGEDLFISKQPTDSPNLCVTLFDSPGLDPEADYRYDRPGLQAIIRGNAGDYDTAYALAESIKEAIRKIFNEVINGTRYIGIWATGDIIPLGYDKKNRPEFSINFIINRTTT